MSIVVTDVYAELDIQDPGSYYGGFKDGRVIEFGDTELIASDWRTGELSGGSTYRYRISDYDRRFRRQLAGFTDRYWTRNVTQWLTNEANRRVLGPAYCAFNGVVMDAQPSDPLGFDITLSDIVTARIFNEKSADSQRVPWRRIGDNGILAELINISEDLDRDTGEGVHYGRHVRAPTDPASADGFRITPVFLGTADVAGDAWYVWFGGGYAPADILDLSTYLLNPDGTVTIASVIANEGTDWLVPHYGGWNAQFGGVPYRDIASPTYGNDRRCWLIYGKVGNTDPDACAAGELVLTVSVHGIEPNGDGTGPVILDRFMQEKDFTINYVANQGLNSYQSGPRLISPSWTLSDGTIVPVVDEESFDNCSAIAIERLPGGIGSPPSDEGYIGAAAITDGTFSSVIAQWNVSTASQFCVDRYGAMYVFMCHPTAAIKAAAPLITDQEDILVFEPRIATNDQANAIPWQTDFDQGTSTYVTTGIYRADDSIVNEEREILGQTRTYPMAPGSTQAFHLARLEGIRAQHKPVYVGVDVPVGPDELDDSLGYLRPGDYVRYRDFRGISNTAGEIRLGQIQRCGIRISKRRVWAEILDVEDLIGVGGAESYDLPPQEAGGGGETTLPPGGTVPNIANYTAFDAIVIPASVNSYEISIDTSAHPTDTNVVNSSPQQLAGAAYHAAWWVFTPDSNKEFSFSTLGSDYDTQLAVFTGDPGGSPVYGGLTLEAYNDNVPPTTRSVITMNLIGGTTYWILVAGYGPADGGTLRFVGVAPEIGDLYVATNGNDGNAGTIDSPYRTIGHALSVLGGPGTVLVRSGTYNEALIENIPSGADWTDKVRIAAFPGETVWLRPSSSVDRVLGFSGTQQYIEIDGINLDGTNATYETVKITDGFVGEQAHHIRLMNLQSITASTGFQSQNISVQTGNAAAANGADEFLNLVVRGASADDFGHGLYISASDCLIDNCDIYGFHGAGVTIQGNFATASGNIVRNSRMRDAAGSIGNGDRRWGIVFGSGTSGNKAYNNLIYNIPLGSSQAGIHNYTGNSNEYYNNTIYNCSSRGLYIEAGSNNVVKNNIAYNNGTNYTDTGTSTTNATNSTSGTDPQFVNAASGDFRLQATSPCIDAGTTVATVTTDKDGIARPQGAAYDQGAHEYVP